VTGMATLRVHYSSELEQLRLQVEVMAVRVERNLERMRAALDDAATDHGPEAAAIDREIDAMHVSLTERCYELIIREAPVASDFRLIMTVLRVLTELERISDHAVTVAANVPIGLVEVEPNLGDLMNTMADEVIGRFHTARRAWGAQDLALAEELARGSRLSEALHQRMVRELVGLRGPSAVELALQSAAAARSLERIGDHTSIIGARLRYLITGDPDHLAAEVR
jgi:phosphate transport system protein